MCISIITCTNPSTQVSQSHGINQWTTDNLVENSKIKVALVEGTDDGISISNDQIEWRDFAETHSIEVSNTEGKKVIYVIFKDEAGNQTLYLK